MSTREELLRGVVRVNNERIDIKAAKEDEQRQVQRANSKRGTAASGESGARQTPATSPVPATQESLEEFALARKGWCEQEVERLRSVRRDHIAACSEIRAQIIKLSREIKKLEEVLDGD